MQVQGGSGGRQKEGPGGRTRAAAPWGGRVGAGRGGPKIGRGRDGRAGRSGAETRRVRGFGWPGLRAPAGGSSGGAAPGQSTPRTRAHAGRGGAPVGGRAADGAQRAAWSRGGAWVAPGVWPLARGARNLRQVALSGAGACRQAEATGPGGRL